MEKIFRNNEFFNEIIRFRLTGIFIAILFFVLWDSPCNAQTKSKEWKMRTGNFTMTKDSMDTGFYYFKNIELFGNEIRVMYPCHGNSMSKKSDCDLDRMDEMLSWCLNHKEALLKAFKKYWEKEFQISRKLAFIRKDIKDVDMDIHSANAITVEFLFNTISASYITVRNKKVAIVKTYRSLE